MQDVELCASLLSCVALDPHSLLPGIHTPALLSAPACCSARCSSSLPTRRPSTPVCPLPGCLGLLLCASRRRIGWCTRVGADVASSLLCMLCCAGMPAVLIDEAGQASEVAALQPLVFGAKRCARGRLAEGGRATGSSAVWLGSCCTCIAESWQQLLFALASCVPPSTLTQARCPSLWLLSPSPPCVMQGGAGWRPAAAARHHPV